MSTLASFRKEVWENSLRNASRGMLRSRRATCHRTRVGLSCQEEFWILRTQARLRQHRDQEESLPRLWMLSVHRLICTLSVGILCEAWCAGASCHLHFAVSKVSEADHDVGTVGLTNRMACALRIFAKNGDSDAL